MGESSILWDRELQFRVVGHELVCLFEHAVPMPLGELLTAFVDFGLEGQNLRFFFILSEGLRRQPTPIK